MQLATEKPPAAAHSKNSKGESVTSDGMNLDKVEREHERVMAYYGSSEFRHRRRVRLGSAVLTATTEPHEPDAPKRARLVYNPRLTKVDGSGGEMEIGSDESDTEAGEGGEGGEGEGGEGGASGTSGARGACGGGGGGGGRRDGGNLPSSSSSSSSSRSRPSSARPKATASSISSSRSIGAVPSRSSTRHQGVSRTTRDQVTTGHPSPLPRSSTDLTSTSKLYTLPTITQPPDGNERRRGCS